MFAATVEDPAAKWVFEYLFSAIGLVVGVTLVVRSVRAKRLSLATLLFFSAVTMFWQEWYADWGAYVLYSDKFNLMPWKSAMTSPNKPWFMLFSYGWFFVVVFTLIPAAIDRVRSRRPDLSRTVVTILVAAPIFYLWDAVVEFGSVAVGYWTYVDTIGPVLDFNGTQIGLLHPLEFFTIYGTLMAFLLTRRVDGAPAFERLLGAHRRPPGWKTEMRRLGAWIVTMNGVYWFGFTMWLLIFRGLFGDDNPLVP